MSALNIAHIVLSTIVVILLLQVAYRHYSKKLHRWQVAQYLNEHHAENGAAIIREAMLPVGKDVV